MKNTLILIVFLALAGACETTKPAIDNSSSLGMAEQPTFPNCTRMIFDQEERACELVNKHGTLPIVSSPVSAERGPLLQSDTRGYGIHLVEVALNNAGQVSFTAQNTGEYVAYLGTPNIPFTLEENNETILPSCSVGLGSTTCSALRRGNAYNLEAGKTYNIKFGPIYPQRWVRLVLVDTTFGRQCEPEELPPLFETCTTAAGESRTLHAPPLSGNHSTKVESDIVYGITLTQETNATNHTGRLDFVPDSDGVYSLYLGTPNIPFAIRDASTGLVVSGQCQARFSARDCTRLRRAYAYFLSRDTAYHLEFRAGAKNRWVRLLVVKDVDNTDPCANARVCTGDRTHKDAGNCSSVTGNLDIVASAAKNLNHLSCLTTVGGKVRINENPTLTNISGLRNLTHINGNLEIIGNNTLPSIGELNILDIGDLDFQSSGDTGNITIRDNATLTNLAGLDELIEVSTIEIDNNDSLTDLSGLEKLIAVRNLLVTDNDNLISLRGLEGLQFVTFGSLHIENNMSLLTLEGLDPKYVDNGVFIRNNIALKKLGAFRESEQIHGGLTISGNSALQNLEDISTFRITGGLSIQGNGNLTSLGLHVGELHGGLFISDNPFLNDLSRITLLTPEFFSGEVRIENNNALDACLAESLADRLGQECTCSGNNGRGTCN